MKRLFLTSDFPEQRAIISTIKWNITTGTPYEISLRKAEEEGYYLPKDLYDAYSEVVCLEMDLFGGKRRFEGYSGEEVSRMEELRDDFINEEGF